jgi:lipid II:glycine glycyltransferase (peptidoglycan interpeptide bridge formation enzyme)
MDLTWTSRLTGKGAEDYDRFVDTARGGHYAQARAWGPVAIAGRPAALRFFVARDGGRVVGTAMIVRPMAGPLPLPIALVERGPVVAEPADLGRVAEALVKRARLHGVARVQVMPYWAGDDVAPAESRLAAAGFTKVHDLEGAHAVTLRMDIGGKTDDAILAGKEREALRRKLRQAEKAGATVRRGEVGDVRVLEQLHAELMKGQGRGTKPAAYFERLASSILAPREREAAARGALFVCTHEAEPISALFVSRHGSLATFVLGATSGAQRSFSKMVLPMMAAVRWARDEGAERFDLGGIPMDGDTDDKRAQIAQFKFDFAKTKVALVGEHARWF